MQIKAVYFLEGQFLGQSEFDCPNLPHSLAYFCATCGEIWGRIHCTTPNHSAHWDTVICPCTRHSPASVQDWSKIPGTVTDAFLTVPLLSTMWHGRALENLPPPVLKREFLLLLSYFEKELAS